MALYGQGLGSPWFHPALDQLDSHPGVHNKILTTNKWIPSQTFLAHERHQTRIPAIPLPFHSDDGRSQSKH
jgi:hypothetical protein